MATFPVDRSELEGLLGDAADPAQPIGASARALLCTARRTRRAESDDGVGIVFGAEEPITVHTVWRATGGALEHGFWRFEIKASTKRIDGPAASDQLVMAEHPYANGFVAVRQFRRSDKRASEQRVPLDAAVDVALAQLAGRTTDPWERGNYVTAAPDLGPLKELLFCRGDLRNYHDDARWVFGVCEDFELFRRMIVEARIAQELCAATQRGDHRVGVPKGTHGTRELEAVHPRAREAAYLVLMVSASQALAGPADAPEGTDRWLGRSVFELVRRIYDGHLWNLSRCYGREDRRLTGQPEY